MCHWVPLCHENTRLTIRRKAAGSRPNLCPSPATPRYAVFLLLYGQNRPLLLEQAQRVIYQTNGESFLLRKYAKQLLIVPTQPPRWTTAGVICVRTTNFKVGLLDLSDVRFVSESTYKERTSRLAPMSGDILYSREGGNPGHCMHGSLGHETLLGRRMMQMRTKVRICDSTFLMHVLNSPATLESVRNLTGGSASRPISQASILYRASAIAPLAVVGARLLCRSPSAPKTPPISTLARGWRFTLARGRPRTAIDTSPPGSCPE
jgi:hypothetical protein